jgi:hypothetical protein
MMKHPKPVEQTGPPTEPLPAFRAFSTAKQFGALPPLPA